MLKRLKLSPVDAGIIFILLALLVSVRLFQDMLFYDPLIAFFKANAKILPELDSLKLFLSLSLRFLINTLLSLGILAVLFKDRGVVKLSAILYVIFFIVLIVAFCLVLEQNKPNLLMLFYIRRFLIQPLFLILFVPAFYYQKKAQ
jgi:exosortase F-associated protein